MYCSLATEIRLYRLGELNTVTNFAKILSVSQATLSSVELDTRPLSDVLIKNFANKGCAVLCHAEAKNPKEWKYHTERAPQLGDLWVWDSYQSDPMGHAGDYYVDDDSRKADKGSGKAMKNINKFGNGPIFMADPAKKPARPGLLMDSEKVSIGNAAVTETPLYMLTPFSGDFADITAQAKHDGGKWTVMLQRKLETGSDTDVQFNTRKKYNLGIAVFENSGMYTKYTSPPMKLEFK